MTFHTRIYTLTSEFDCNIIVTEIRIFTEISNQLILNKMGEPRLGTDVYFEIDLITDPKTNDYGTDANYKAVACGNDTGYSAENSPIDTSNKCSGGYGSVIPGQGSFSFDFNGQQTVLLGDEEDIKVTNQDLAVAQDAKQVFFARSRTLDNAVYREGKVMIPSYSEANPNAEVATFTATFNGIGRPRLVAPVTP